MRDLLARDIHTITDREGWHMAYLECGLMAPHTQKDHIMGAVTLKVHGELAPARGNQVVRK